MIEMIGAIFSFLVIVLTQIFSDKRKSELANEKYELGMAAFLKAADQAISKMRQQAKEENKQVGDVEDRMDQDGKPPHA